MVFSDVFLYKRVLLEIPQRSNALTSQPPKRAGLGYVVCAGIVNSIAIFIGVLGIVVLTLDRPPHPMFPLYLMRELSWFYYVIVLCFIGGFFALCGLALAQEARELAELSHPAIQHVARIFLIMSRSEAVAMAVIFFATFWFHP